MFDNHMIHLVKRKVSKNVYSRRRITPPKVSNFSFWDCPCSSSFNFFDVVLKTTNFNISENADIVYLLLRNKPENVIKMYRLKVYRKKIYAEPLSSGDSTFQWNVKN